MLHILDIPRREAAEKVIVEVCKTATNEHYRIAHNVSSRKRIDIIARAKQLGVKVTNAKAKVTTEV